jgi:hypothetical protein
MTLVIDKLNNQNLTVSGNRSTVNGNTINPLSSTIDNSLFSFDHSPLTVDQHKSLQKLNVQTNVDPARDFIRRIMPPWAYGISSVWHLLTAGILSLGNFSDSTNKTWTRYATGFTKTVNSLVYADLAREALNKGYAFEFLGRVAEPVMNLFVDLNHYHLFRAFSSAFNQLHSINLSRVKEGTPIWQNFIDNLEASKDFFMEVWTSRGGKINEKFGGGARDKGHTLALASHMQIIVGALALLNGIKRNMTNRVLGVARNLAGVIADIGLLFEKDFSARRVGMLYLAHAVGDTVKRFLPNKMQDVVDNAIMPLYNAAMYYFGLMGRRQNDGVYQMHDAPPHNVHLETVAKAPASVKPAVTLAA